MSYHLIGMRGLDGPTVHLIWALSTSCGTVIICTSEDDGSLAAFSIPSIIGAPGGTKIHNDQLFCIFKCNKKI